MGKITLFEIRLDDDLVVLRGSENESTAAAIRGKIVLSCTDRITVKALWMKINALERFRILENVHGPFGPAPKVYKLDQCVYTHRMVFQLPGNSIPAGNHEFPFEHILPGDSPESVEGYNRASILWDLNATLERGVLSSDLHASKHLRVVRTLPTTALEFSQTMVVENIWPNKVEYSVSIPSKAVVFGSYIPLEVRLSPLFKGLKVGKITVALKEVHEFNPKGVPKTDQRQIMQVEFPGFDDPPTEEDDGQWVLREKMSLPRSLAKCLQDCEVQDIKIRHKLKFAIQLHNPDGHVSELRATLPVMLYISQNYLVNDANEVPEVTSQVTAESEIAAPPCYEQHKYDQLWEGVDIDIYSSPPITQANSPMALSRTGSAENLTQPSSGLISQNSISGSSSPRHYDSTSRSSNISSGSVSGLPSILTQHGHADLVARLQRAHNMPAGSSGSLNALANSTSWTNPSSGRDSPNPESPVEQMGNPSPPLDLESMCKVPSYNTAIKTPARNLSFESTPVYERVSSNAPSRQASSQSLVDMATLRPTVSRSSSSSGHTASEEQHGPGHESRVPKLFQPRWRA